MPSSRSIGVVRPSPHEVLLRENIKEMILISIPTWLCIRGWGGCASGGGVGLCVCVHRWFPPLKCPVMRGECFKVITSLEMSSLKSQFTFHLIRYSISDIPGGLCHIVNIIWQSWLRSVLFRPQCVKYWSLGNLDAIFKMQFSVLFYWLVSSDHQQSTHQQPFDHFFNSLMR